MNYPNYLGQNPFMQQNNNGLLWVQGEAGAKSWIVAPNQTVILMDSERDQFYIKSADASGMPTLKTYRYEALDAKRPEYVTKEDFLELKNKLDAIETKLSKKKKGAEDE